MRLSLPRQLGIPGLPGLPGLPALAGPPGRRAVRALPSPWSAVRVLTAELARPSRRPRRVWSRHGAAHIELMAGAPAPVGHRVTRVLRALHGVNWAEVDEGLGRVLVTFDADEIDISELVDAVTEVEEAFSDLRERLAEGQPVTGEMGEPTAGVDRPEHPADVAPLTTELIALGVDVAALGFAVVGRVCRVPAIPRAAAAAVALVDHQPRARRVLERRLGRRGADLALGITGAGIAALSQSPDTILVSVVHRCVAVGELTAMRSAFTRREPELLEATRRAAATELGRLGQVARERRPRPLPPGPVERCADRMAAVGLGLGTASFAATRSPVFAGDILLATVPRAARLGREVFAASVARRLCARDVLPLDPACLRRLDRVDTVVVSAPALLSDRPRVLSAPDGATWTAVDALLDGLDVRRRYRPGRIIARSGGTRLVAAHSTGDRAAADRDGLPVQLRTDSPPAAVSAFVGVEVDGHAEAVLRAARGCGTLLLSRHASAADLAPLADAEARGEAELATEVWRFQAGGGVVLVVGGSEDIDGLHRADVSIGLVRSGERPPWSADLLCAQGLADAWRVLQLPPVAAAASRRSATLAFSGSALATLITGVGGDDAGGAGGTAGPGQPLSRLLLRSGPVSAAALTAMMGSLIAAGRVDRRPLPAPVWRTDWHALGAEAVLRRLHARPRDPETLSVTSSAGPLSAGPFPVPLPTVARPGLVALRWARRSAEGVGHGMRRLGGAVAADLRDPMVPVLLVGAAASAVLGSTVDAALVAGVSVTNAVLSGAQRARADVVLDRLMARHLPLARLITTDGPRVVPAGELRVGDLIEVGSGDVAPADVRLTEAIALEVDEATLTGESIPVDKGIEPTPAAAMAERRCMLYDGTTVLAGTGRGVVVAVGPATEAGRASAAAAGHRAPPGVQARLGELTRFAMPLTGASGLAVAGLSWIRGTIVREAVGAGVAVAVAAVPEGLPLVATVAQVAAARRLARLGVLVRSSRTVEALGRVDTVCFDKTGTLTEGRLVLRQVVPFEAVAEAGAPDRDRDDRSTVLRVAAAACPSPSGPVPHATDRAVLEAGAAEPDLGRRLVELPFETTRGYAVTLVQTGDAAVLAVKGAPEILLGRCRLGEEQAAAARRTADTLAARGLRVLAVARSPALTGPVPGGIPDDLVRDLRLAGFVGLADTPRPSAAPAIRRLVDAGMRIMMVTGDHPGTAAAIAAEVGIPGVTADTVVTGPELDRLGDEAFARRVGSAAVFARISPEQKVRLVDALQRGGHTVAMTGDGTNDAAAIRAADVGVAVEGRGAAAATGAADLLLTAADVDKLVDAVFEGRRMWRSVTDAVSILVGGNAGEVTFTLVGTAVGGTAPLNPRQLLLVNLLTDMAPAMALAVRGRAGDADRPPASILAGPLRQTLVLRGLATTAAATGAWLVARRTGTAARASTVALLALVGTQLGQTLTLAGRDPLVIATALGSVGVLAIIVQTPVVSSLFGCRPVGPVGWTVAAGSASVATATAWVAARRGGLPGLRGPGAGSAQAAAAWEPEAPSQRRTRPVSSTASAAPTASMTTAARR